MTMDELAVLDGDKCILQLYGVRQFLSHKYDVAQHPFYQETGEFDARNKLDIEKYLKGGIKFKKGEEYLVIQNKKKSTSLIRKYDIIIWVKEVHILIITKLNGETVK